MGAFAITVDRWARCFWLGALVWMLGCSQASDGGGLYDSDASVEDLAASSEALVIGDDDEDSGQDDGPLRGMATLASTLVCGRSEYASSTCPNSSVSVSGWPQTPLNGMTYTTTGWKGQLGQIGPGLANTWVTLTMTVSSSDPDLYVKKNGSVSVSSYDCRPWSASSPEYCAFYLDRETDYLTWGIDVYSVAYGSATVRVDIDVRRCGAGAVYTGIDNFADSGANAPPVMQCCNCASGYVESGGQCCRDIVECTQPSDCASGSCVDGYCCDKACAGGCERCDLPQAEGLCKTLSAGAASCGAYVCNGTSPSCPTSCTNHSQCASGHYCNGTSCVPKLDNGTACSLSVQCKANHCSEGLCCDQACGNYRCIGWTGSCPTSCASNADCLSSAYCNASNACVPKLSQGSSCTANHQCASGSCADGVCCNVACGAACDRCDLPSSVGTCTNVIFGSAGQPSCSPYVCNGTSANCPTSCASDIGCAMGFICKAGFCEPKAENGASCSNGNECASGFCIDGVCCNGACNGGCERCDLSGSKGMCTFLTAGKPGSGCGDYLCNGKDASCPSSCSNDTQCASHAYCYAGRCEPKSPQGAVCSSDGACESGFCVDGTCCESACDGQCERCDSSGALGSCTKVAGKPVGKRASCSDDGRGCGGVCDGVNGASCSYPGAAVACAEASCMEGRELGAGACNGEGACEQPGRPCAPYACGATACRSSCATGADCSGSAECIEGQCRGVLDDGSACALAGECKSGHCVDGVCCISEASCSGDGEAEDFLSEDESGCGCTTVGAGQDARKHALLAAIVLGLAIRRRKRPHPAST